MATGHVMLGPGVAERVVAAFNGGATTAAPFPELTDRERDAPARGAGTEQPGDPRELSLAPKTVANHVSNILIKLQMADRRAAIVAARRTGLADERPAT